MGSSLGDRLSNLRLAIQRLEDDSIPLKVEAVSAIYESPHLGLNPEDEERFPAHLNLVVAINIYANLTPHALLERIQNIETLGGRERRIRWSPRTIDIDILTYGDLRLNTATLTLPHPEMEKRLFVVQPLLDLEPNFCLPEGSKLALRMSAEPLATQVIHRTPHHLQKSKEEWVVWQENSAYTTQID